MKCICLTWRNKAYSLRYLTKKKQLKTSSNRRNIVPCNFARKSGLQIELRQNFDQMLK